MEINKLIETTSKLNNSHKFCAEELLVPGVNKCDMIRINMFDNHLPQAVVLAEGDFANVFTNFENQVGEYSSAFGISDRDWTIIKKIKKNKMCYTFILKDEDGNIALVNTTPAERITERYGYKNINPINKKKVNEVIKKDEVMFRNTSYDKDMNFCYGRNLKAVYLSFKNMTYEDAIVISESGKEKLKSYSVDETIITLNNNDILINKYGDNNNYKCLPDLGEVIDGTILTARKRINYDSLLFDGSVQNLNEINFDTDTVFYIGKNSVIYDIDVYGNADYESLKKYPYYKQILEIVENNKRYYTEVVNVLTPYIEDENFICSDDIKYFYRRSLDLISDNSEFKHDGNTFDNLVLKIRTYNENPLVIGSKITGRYGNKGVIGCILPDDQMPTNEFGEVADICLNPTGVVGRENIEQLYEIELNFIADYVVRESRKIDDIEEKFEYILSFYKILESEFNTQYSFLKKEWKKASDKKKKKMINEIYKKGLYIHEPPFFGNSSIETLEELYETFGYHPYKMTVDGKEIEQPMIMANLYFIRLILGVIKSL